jgi:glutathione S-transferase
MGRRFRHGIERFFKDYRRGHGRNGRYLLAADLVQPLWDALYESPDQLRRSHPAGQSHLALLEARVRRSMFGDRLLVDLLARLTALGDVEHLKRISSGLQIPYTLWFANGTVAQSTADFLARVPEEKLPGLVDALVHEEFLRSGPDHALG